MEVPEKVTACKVIPFKSKVVVAPQVNVPMPLVVTGLELLFVRVPVLNAIFPERVMLDELLNVQLFCTDVDGVVIVQVPFMKNTVVPVTEPPVNVRLFVTFIVI